MLFPPVSLTKYISRFVEMTKYINVPWNKMKQTELGKRVFSLWLLKWLLTSLGSNMEGCILKSGELGVLAMSLPSHNSAQNSGEPIDQKSIIGGMPVNKVKFPHRKTTEILLMEEILHHLTCMNPCKEWDKLPSQLVQDFFHQQYQSCWWMMNCDAHTKIGEF